MLSLFRSCREAEGCVPGVCPSAAKPYVFEEGMSSVASKPALSSSQCTCVAVDGGACLLHKRPNNTLLKQWVFGGTHCAPEDAATSSTCSGAQESRLVQEAMATFIRTLLRGICIEVLLDDGSVLFPETSLDYELTHLLLDVNDAQRSIPLIEIESIATPADLARRQIFTSISPHLDERCCTLIIRGCEFVTFRLDTERHREYFAACLALLIARTDATEPQEAAAVEVSESRAECSKPSRQLQPSPAGKAYGAQSTASVDASAKNPPTQLQSMPKASSMAVVLDMDSPSSREARTLNSAP